MFQFWGDMLFGQESETAGPSVAPSFLLHCQVSPVCKRALRDLRTQPPACPLSRLPGGLDCRVHTQLYWQVRKAENARAHRPGRPGFERAVTIYACPLGLRLVFENW